MNKEGQLDRLRVLLVDDNHHMLNIVKTILRGFGVKEFVDAHDAAEAFDHLKDGRVDLIVLDYQMAMLDGVEFVRLVRSGADVPNPFIPIIMLTAHSERSRVLAARDAGVNEFCCKPVTATELWRKLSSCVSQPRTFVRTNGFVGPDRRRHDGTYAGPDRRAARNPETPNDGQRSSG